MKIAISKLKYSIKELEGLGSNRPELKEQIESYKLAIEVLSQPIWTNDKVIEFVNWYLKLQKINPLYELENQTVIDSFLNGDPVEAWDNEYTPKNNSQF